VHLVVEWADGGEYTGDGARVAPGHAGRLLALLELEQGRWDG
jgi:hypothetical protein